jgi:hypothetical protein
MTPTGPRLTPLAWTFLGFALGAAVLALVWSLSTSADWKAEALGRAVLLKQRGLLVLHEKGAGGRHRLALIDVKLGEVIDEVALADDPSADGTRIHPAPGATLWVETGGVWGWRRRPHDEGTTVEAIGQMQIIAAPPWKAWDLSAEGQLRVEKPDGSRWAIDPGSREAGMLLGEPIGAGTYSDGCLRRDAVGDHHGLVDPAYVCGGGLDLTLSGPERAVVMEVRDGQSRFVTLDAAGALGPGWQAPGQLTVVEGWAYDNGLILRADRTVVSVDREGRERWRLSR